TQGDNLPSNCCSSPSAANCSNNRNNIPDNLKADFDKCVAGGKGGLVVQGSPGGPETPAALTITQYRKAENPTALSSASFVSYPAGGTVIPFSFSDTSLGDKFIFVQFKDNRGGVTAPTEFSAKIQFSPNPEITGPACNLDLKDGSLVFKVDGSNFGSRNSSSTLTADNSTLETESWEDKRVVARMKTPPDVTKGRNYSITLKRSDGAQVTSECKVDTTQIALGAKLFCRTQNNFDQDNVDMSIFQTQGVGVSGPQFVVTSKTAEKVTIGKDGVIQNVKTVLQEGAQYMICLKAPLSLRSCTDRFISTSGTNLIKDFVLPRGDLNADDSINSIDASSLKRQWGPVTSSSTKNCDFNRDGQCNSFEWGCMLKDFNASSAKEPQ
ncbi:hypothetical protein HY386_00355, partial [Candidatus Daviesbacteria bacterium]|nr:hypothetical protein [Candidatus Daviesbacteria bacterium]